MMTTEKDPNQEIYRAYLMFIFGLAILETFLSIMPYVTNSYASVAIIFFFGLSFTIVVTFGFDFLSRSNRKLKRDIYD